MNVDFYFYLFIYTSSTTLSLLVAQRSDMNSEQHPYLIIEICIIVVSYYGLLGKWRRGIAGHDIPKAPKGAYEDVPGQAPTMSAKLPSCL